jgi:hypothetical protein
MSHVKRWALAKIYGLSFEPQSNVKNKSRESWGKWMNEIWDESVRFDVLKFEIQIEKGVGIKKRTKSKTKVNCCECDKTKVYSI